MKAMGSGRVALYQVALEQEEQFELILTNSKEGWVLHFLIVSKPIKNFRANAFFFFFLNVGCNI